MTLTDKQKEARLRDCKVRYGRAVQCTGSAKAEGLVPDSMFAALDKERLEKWIPEEVIKAMPQWAPKP